MSDAENLYWMNVKIHVPEWQLNLHAKLFLEKLANLEDSKND